MKKQLNPDKIYYVFCPEDRTVLIAMNIEFGEKEIRWFDSVKERIMEIESIISDNPEQFVFSRKGVSGTYAFVPMTLEIFREKVKDRILIPQDFETEEEMIKAFKETINNAW